MKRLLIPALLLLLAVGCTSEVKPGYIGMIQTPSGLTGEVLQPGRHTAFGRDRMVWIENKEETVTENLSILVADDLNFKFDLKVRTRLKISDGKGIKALLNRKGSDMKNDILPFVVLYKTYVRPVARSRARAIVSKYQTTQIRNARQSIEKEIFKQLISGTAETPMEVVFVATSNFDYPDVVTKAVERKREREIQINEEKAKQAVELLKISNRQKIAQKLKTVRAAEAEAEAVYLKVVGSALTDRYLKLRNMENQKVLFGNAGKGDKIILLGIGANVTPLINTK